MTFLEAIVSHLLDMRQKELFDGRALGVVDGEMPGLIGSTWIRTSVEKSPHSLHVISEEGVVECGTVSETRSAAQSIRKLLLTLQLNCSERK